MHLTCPQLAALPHVAHGFFTRQGGISEGIFASLNCGYGSGDAVAHVEENRRRVATALNFSATQLCTPYQIHSPTVVHVEQPWAWQDAPQADALVTTTPGILLGILTADCVPVLLADGKQNVIAAAHAGWKGAFGGVLEATLDAMEQLGARREGIIATIGPAIAQASYEVGPEFVARFTEGHAVNAQFFVPSMRAGHCLFDLKAYVKGRLAAAKLAAIHVLPHDTCADSEHFFSYRRATLRGEATYGRQISVIGLKE